ncbi:MAG: hypothetical protein ACR2HA_07585 [Nocardioides sp.]
MRTLVRAASVVAVLLALTGCSEPPGRSQAELSVPPASASPTAVQFDEDLHDELLGMLERDQSEHTGGPLGEGDDARTARLKEIIAARGWPIIDLVG